MRGTNEERIRFHTIRQVEVALGVPFMTAQRYVEKLVEAGLLREITGQARNRIYRADAIMQAIEGQSLDE